MQMIERFFEPVFQLRRRGSNVPREILAGLTTFGAVSYIIIVNPVILAPSHAGLEPLIIGTALAAMMGTLIMALWANLPIALAPGMGTNVVFAQIVIVKMGLSYATALTLVLVSAGLFLLLAATRLREKIVAGFPESIRVGMQCGIGLLIAYIGLNNGGLISHANGELAFGTLTDGRVILGLVGLVLTPALVALGMPAALLLSIVLIALAGIFVHGPDGAALTRLPAQWVQIPDLSHGLIILPDVRGYVTHLRSLAPVTLYFLLSAFFSTTATLIAVTRRAGIVDQDGNIPRFRQAYAADGLASIPGALLGMPTLGTYAESATGVAAGGRTGLTGIVVAALFGLSLFFWPVIAVIPPVATTPALVIVGLMMMEGVFDLRADRPDDFAPAVIIMLITVTTSDLMIGMALGCFAYTAIAVARRQWRSLTMMVLAIDLIFVAYLFLSTQVT
jgi:AGZA family xanthine/uracil permease-like MFS transporter